MAGERMPTAPLIEEYVRDISPDLYGGFWARRRIVEELTDHLLETVHRFQQQGTSWVEAQKRAIAQFGSPRLVAQTFAQSKGVGVPTTFTRYSGLAGIAGSVILTIAVIWQTFSVWFSHNGYGGIAAAAVALLCISLVGLYVRCRGQLGSLGRLGFRLFFIGLALGFGMSMLWFTPGALVGLLTLCVGLVAYLVALVRSNVLPRIPIAIVACGIVGTVAIGLVGMVIGYDTGFAGALVGLLGMDIGLIGIGRFMWSEKAVDRSEWNDPGLPA